MVINLEKKVLANGVRLVLVPLKNTQAVTILVLAGVGSRYEPKSLNGISHLLEHLFFKGTKKRPRPGQIHQELDRIGALHNAFTSKETTGFWVKSAGDYFDIDIDVIADILLEPIFKEEEIRKEKEVILQEIKMYEDEPRRRIWDFLEKILFGQHPLAMDITGTEESIKAIQRSDILNFQKRNYLSKNIVISVAGDIKSDVCFKKIKKFFGGIKKGRNKPARRIKINQRLPRVEIFSKKTDQVHIGLGVRTFDFYDERKYALEVLSVILGGNFSSRLFQDIREKHGLAYYVYSFNDFYRDCGYLGVGVGVSRENTGKAVKKIFDNLKKIKEKGISYQELKFAQNYIKGQMALKLEKSEEVAAFCGEQELFYKKILQPKEILEEKIMKVDRSSVLKLAREIFLPSRINLAVIGDFEELRDKENEFKNLFLKL